MQLLAYLLQAAGHVLLLDWTTSKQFLSHFYWMLWWLATNLGFIAKTVAKTPSCLLLVGLGGRDTSCLSCTTKTLP
ncbi:hypothetical protein DY000_02053506 [Brassica cretica]|uniref:Uncharacterized protein n=1 Tax=Brassica cretica TaxID=69181 RepID=A0ABQ7ALM8_BRACR|nr:hypothetical protein DY000_02053506 [Brassica cretica]